MFNLVAKQPWKKLKLDEFDDLIECQVLTDYTIDKTNHVEDTGIDKQKKVKTKTKKTKDFKQTTDHSEQENEKITKQPKIKSSLKDADLSDMDKWQGLGVSEVVLQRLKEMKFYCPTPIQLASLPSAIKNRSDIIAAAATGSGKTLVFGIPIVSHILEIDENDFKEESENLNEEKENGNDDNNEDVLMLEMTDETSNDESDNIVEETISSIADCEKELNNEDKSTSDSSIRPMYSLILTPTRELAMQVTQHITSICKYTSIKVTAVVGGISVEKQERLLKKQPQIVVATPGRLWQLMQLHQKHLCNTKHLRHLVVDEVDRMAEKGHFQELQHIINYVQQHSSFVLKRQVFILSATLSFVHKKPHRTTITKKKLKDLTIEDKIDSLKKTLQMSAKPKVIDLTTGVNMTSQRLQEFKVSCGAEKKDAMLFHLMTSSPSRTLVFANSKDSIRRLNSLFGLIQCSPLCLHSDMPMRQRLKNLDTFKARDSGLLLATDVAARGLDIAMVARVVHYQVPRTVENYVHRSGRTARSDQGGVSVLLVSPQEDALYRRIMLALKKESGLDELQINRTSLQHHTSIVHNARQLEVLIYRQKKKKVDSDWWKQACKDAELVCSDDEDEGGRKKRSKLDNDDEIVSASERKSIEIKKKELLLMLGVSIRKKNKRKKNN